ncbi:MAG TPA: hypothetical protein VMJ32_18560 [Pirellulales bacterium]|nr:hypothetical protein [Pirellulales bacterium]
MKREFQRLLFGCIPSALFLAIAWEVSGQQVVQFPASGMKIVKCPYNDANFLANMAAEKVFGSLEGRKAYTAELLQTLDRFIPILQAELEHPGSQLGSDPTAALAKMYHDHPEVAEKNKALTSERIRMCNVYRLAVDEPRAVSANQAALAQGGEHAAQAAIDRAAADWLNAYENSASQNTALDALHSAIDAAAQKPSFQLWWTLWEHRPPASEAVAQKIIANLQPYANEQGAARMNLLLQFQIKRMQLADKPLTIDGTLISGAHFSTARWKGKVVLIDGWYTHGPKPASQIAEAQNFLTKHQTEGLEVLGLSYDETLNGAKIFLAAHPECKFPVMYQLTKANAIYSCVPLGEYRFGDDAMGPSMVIDRKGTMHYLDQKHDPQQVEAQLIKLLAEAP